MPLRGWDNHICLVLINHTLVHVAHKSLSNLMVILMNLSYPSLILIGMVNTLCYLSGSQQWMKSVQWSAIHMHTMPVPTKALPPSMWWP